MAPHLSVQDALLPVLTMVVFLPVAVLGFKYGVPIEIIVFGLLVAGYKGAHSLKLWGLTPETRWWRPKPPVANKPPKPAESKSPLNSLKKNNAAILQWRSLINKLTPEKFDKLCEKLIETIPRDNEDEGITISNEEFKQVLEDMLTLIFETSSRQHQYTEMYTDLCQRILDFVAQQKPEMDGRSCIWNKCQHIFLTNVLKAPEIPDHLPEDEYADRKAKNKEKMVGMVKFGGDLVSRGLVPCDGVMQWIHSLLSEKAQEVFSSDSDAAAALCTSRDGDRDKDMEQREVQLEVLCAILASMGSSLSDSNTWSEANRRVIEDVFEELEQLSMDTMNLSLRIRCLIRDILDLRMAQWKEKEGKLKPSLLRSRKKEGDEDQRAEGGAGGSAAGSSRDEGAQPCEVRTWLDPQLITSLQAVEHHLEVIDDKDAKLQRLKAVIQLYNLIQEKQIVVVANSSNVRRVVDLIAESFKDVDFKALDFNTPEQIRKKSIGGFIAGETSILVMASEVSTRRDFDFGKAAAVLVNFDFPMTLQLYLYRLFKRADSNSHVFTFFCPHFDIRHTVPLIAAMDGAKQKVPAALHKLREQVKQDSRHSGHDSKDSGGPRRTPKGEAGGGRGDRNSDRNSFRETPDHAREDAGSKGSPRLARTRSSPGGASSSTWSSATWRSEAVRHEESREELPRAAPSCPNFERRREPLRRPEAAAAAGSSATPRHFEGDQRSRHFEGDQRPRHFEGDQRPRHFEGATDQRPRHFEAAAEQRAPREIGQDGRDWQLRARAGATGRRGPVQFSEGRSSEDWPSASHSSRQHPQGQGEDRAYRVDRPAWGGDHGADARRGAEVPRSPADVHAAAGGARGDRKPEVRERPLGRVG